MQDNSLLQLIEEEMKAWEAAMPFVQLFDARTATAEQWKTVSLSRMLAPEVLGSTHQSVAHTAAGLQSASRQSY